ncbi:MAG: 50S ribosomal protein L23 [Bacteriovoracia bacterium]
MALFGKKKDKEEKKTSNKKETAVNTAHDLTWVLKGPRITEKGAVIAESNNVYTFNIDKSANKNDVKKAIEAIYKVNPIKVAISKIPTKQVQVRGQRGKFGNKGGGKKAFVYLKKGEKIEFV